MEVSENEFLQLLGVNKEKVVETIIDMSKLMNCDYKTAYDKYCHTMIKNQYSWDEIKQLLDVKTS